MGGSRATNVHCPAGTLRSAINLDVDLDGVGSWVLTVWNPETIIHRSQQNHLLRMVTFWSPNHGKARLARTMTGSNPALSATVHSKDVNVDDRYPRIHPHCSVRLCANRGDS